MDTYRPSARFPSASTRYRSWQKIRRKLKQLSADKCQIRDGQNSSTMVETVPTADTAVVNGPQPDASCGANCNCTALQDLTRLVNGMNERQKTIEQLLVSIDRKVTLSISRDIAPSPFPIMSLNALIKVDDRLDAPDIREHLSAILRTTDGSTTSKLVRNILERLIARKLVASINYSGAHGKYAFKKTALNTLIISEVERRAPEGTATRHAVSEAICSWIRDCSRTIRSRCGAQKEPEILESNECDDYSKGAIIKPESD